MTATLDPTTVHERVPLPAAALPAADFPAADFPAARLSLTPAGSAPGLLDGAWWPRSRDLTRELPALAAALDKTWGRITRVAVNPARWPVIPRKVPVSGHTVRVGWFAAEQDQNELLLLSYTSGRWDLLVVPPGTGETAAARLMATAAAPGGLLTASAVMAGGGSQPVRGSRTRAAEGRATA